MNSLNMSIENIFAANGVTIAITGMIIVFAALIVISSFIALLPKLLPLLEKVFPEEAHHQPSAPSQPADHEKVLAAIGYALFKKQTASLPAK